MRRHGTGSSWRGEGGEVSRLGLGLLVRGTEMQSVLIANINLEEIRAVCKAIGKEYEALSITTPEELDGLQEKCEAILLDHGFTDRFGFDILRRITSRSHLPVVMITPPDDPKCAIEAMRLGAHNYIVKTANYRELLVPSIKEAVDKFNERQELKETIAGLKERVAELEAQLASHDHARAGEKPPEEKTSLILEIAARFKRGEVNLPSYPEINTNFRKLLHLGAGVSAVAGLLKKDMGISSKLIGISNSPYYRGLSESKTVEQAIGRLGLEETKKYVAVITNRALYVTHGGKFGDFLNDLWAHSLSCAYASEAISRELRIPGQDEFFTLGLLHDIGKLVLIQVVAEIEAGGRFGNGADTEELSVTMKAYHGSFGQAILKKWGLPAVYGQIAQYHDSMEKADSISRELQVIHLGNLIALALGHGQKQPVEIDLQNAASSTLLGMTQEKITKVQEQVRKGMENASLF
jgi:HD-like signal output (HDOD) protein/response regulator of citrate/malate metabolism